MNALHTRLTEIAFHLNQDGDDLDREAAAWIMSRVKADRQRKRKPRRRKVRLKDHGKAGTFYLDPHRLEEEDKPC